MLQIFVIIAALLLSLQNPVPIFVCPEGGGHIAFSANGLKLLDTATGEVTTLVEKQGDTRFDQFSWSPDGTRVAFDTNQSGTWGIYTVEVSESGEALGEPQVMFDSLDADESRPIYSPDGTRLAFTLDGRLHVANLDDDDMRDLTVETWQFLWSTDGSRLLYVVNEESGWALASIDAASSDAAEITSGQDIAYSISISPDGMLLIELIPASDSLIFVIDAQSGEMTDLETDGAIPQWSPDGRQIAFIEVVADYQMGIEIMVMDADGTNREVYTENFLHDVRGKIRWSPDGTRIAFDAYGMDYEYSRHVHVLDVETHEVMAFENAPLSDVAPQWRPCAVS